MNEFFFGVYPYICLVILTVGLVFRYLATPGEWNSRSSNLFAKKSLAYGSYIFHYSIIFAFLGHVFGLLTPPCILNAFGFSTSVHMAVAGFFGKFISVGVFAGLCILLWRRVSTPQVWASTVAMDIVVLLLIMWQACSGGMQDFGSNYDVFATIAPWVRGMLLGQPDPALMANVPFFLKTHVVVGLLIMALIPFSRLVHFFSIPLTWFARPLISYRRRYENL